MNKNKKLQSISAINLIRLSEINVRQTQSGEKQYKRCRTPSFSILYKLAFLFSFIYYAFFFQFCLFFALPPFFHFCSPSIRCLIRCQFSLYDKSRYKLTVKFITEVLSRQYQVVRLPTFYYLCFNIAKCQWLLKILNRSFDHI